jgi:hypothetical protein
MAPRGFGPPPPRLCARLKKSPDSVHLTCLPLSWRKLLWPAPLTSLAWVWRSLRWPDPLTSLAWAWRGRGYSVALIRLAQQYWGRFRSSVVTAILPNDVACFTLAEAEGSESKTITGDSIIWRGTPLWCEPSPKAKRLSGIVFGLNGHIPVALNPAIPIFTDAAFV